MFKNIIIVASLLVSSIISAQETFYSSPTNNFTVSKITEKTFLINFPVDVQAGYKTVVADKETVLNVIEGIERIYSDKSYKKGGQFIIDGWVITRYKKVVMVQPWK